MKREEILWVIEMFVVFIVVMIQRLYTYGQANQIVHFKRISLMHFSDTTIKLYQKKNIHTWREG